MRRTFRKQAADEVARRLQHLAQSGSLTFDPAACAVAMAAASLMASARRGSGAHASPLQALLPRRRPAACRALADGHPRSARHLRHRRTGRPARTSGGDVARDDQGGRGAPRGRQTANRKERARAAEQRRSQRPHARRRRPGSVQAPRATSAAITTSGSTTAQWRDRRPEADVDHRRSAGGPRAGADAAGAPARPRRVSAVRRRTRQRAGKRPGLRRRHRLRRSGAAAARRALPARVSNSTSGPARRAAGASTTTSTRSCRRRPTS